MIQIAMFGKKETSLTQKEIKKNEVSDRVKCLSSTAFNQ